MARTSSITLGLLILFACVADAHAILTSSLPGPKQVIKGPEIAVKLTFNSRIDAKRSRITLLRPDRSESPLIIGDQPSPGVLTSAAKDLKSGAYVLRWQVLAHDGHISRGEIPFSVQ
jgi:methionine-rich copper-binding protein CopC